ncbi:MAG: tetratricopeptide repeat protein [Deltaproteobacteria bacterium]|nr:tetratricopeptide repeat protein [Deltaproteobacteria bacterium]
MELFGKYSLVRRIGAGGMAEVFLARTSVAQGLAKTLVIKKIHPAFARSRQFVTMFVDEAKIALGLNHPNIIQVFDFGAVGDTYFLAMEYVDGMDLLRLLQDMSRDRKRLPYGLAAYIVQQVAKGLDYAHRKADEFGEALGIVHRDISPQNVLLSWDGAVKIVDFGIARARDVHEDEGVIKGKFAYMSPEQARGEPVDCRSDVFALGIVLYELVAARPLFPGKGKEVLELVKAGAIPPVRDHAPELPDSLERILTKALAYHRGDRYQTARDMQNDLGRYQLEEAQKSGELLDSGALAQFLAQLVPADRRKPSSRPPAAKDERGASAATPVSVVPLSLGALGDDDDAAIAGKDAADLRTRKYVYVLEGLLRGTGALERRVGKERAQRLIAEFHQVARDVAFKNDATVDASRPGEFGMRSGELGALRVVVGLPVAGEDDAARAIRIALALVDALDGIGSDVEPELRLSLGIQRGVATVPRRPLPGRPPFELEEQTTGFAHKLAQLARGAEILVGGRVFRAARADWSFEPLPAIDLPAEADTQSRADEDTEPGVRRARVYRLRGPKERAQRLRERLRGGGKATDRDLELKALRDAWRDVRVTKRKRQLVIVGDTGVGKRTLVTAFLDSIAPGEAYVLRTSTRVGTAMTPYGVIADLARDILGLAEGAEPHEVQRRIERALPMVFPGPGEDQSREARGAKDVIGLLLGIRTSPGDGDIDPDERRQRVLQVMLRVEQRLQPDKPLVVVGEDVHWSDQESLDLFAQLLKIGTSRPVLGIVTTRPEPRVLRAAKDSGAELIHLDELSPTARRRVVTDKFVPGHDAAELVDQIVARAGGNPFFIHELLDALIERGVVVPDPDDAEHPGLLRWVKRDAAIQVPSSIEDVLATRFDRLPPNEKQVLLHAAVLGRAIPTSAASALVGRAAAADLDELVRRGLLVPHEGEYRFKNDMIMTVAYGLVAPEDRTRLHRIAAERIASASGYRAGQDDATIARHLELAGDAVQAAERYLRAAGHAVDVGGNADAFRQLSRALKLLPVDDHLRRFTAHKQREEILRRLARRPQQLREIHALRKEAEALADPAKLAHAHAALAQFYIEVGKAPAAARAVVPALEYARAAGDKLAEAEAIRLRAAISRLIGQNDEALRLGEQALALTAAAGSGPPHLLARAKILNNQGTTLWTMGRLEQAIEAYAEALVIYRALKLPRQEAHALNNMGIVFNALGEFEEALAHYKSALKLDQALGDRAGIAYKLGNIGQCYADLGDLARAESYLGKAMKIAVETGDDSTEADAAISLGQVELLRRRPDEATTLFERGLELATAGRDRYQEIRALQYIALAQLEAGQPPEGALELARSATELARKMPMMVGIIHGLAFQALALSKLGQHATAVAESRESVRLMDAQTRPEGAEHILIWHAQVLTAAGLTEEAAAVRSRARAEVDAKAARLADPELRRMYLGSRP